MSVCLLRLTNSFLDEVEQATLFQVLACAERRLLRSQLAALLRRSILLEYIEQAGLRLLARRGLRWRKLISIGLLHGFL